MARIYIPSAGPEAWQQFLADPVKQWRVGYSAHACAHACEQAAGLPADIAQALGGDAELLLAIPEHKVPLPGKGAPSQCDVFALVRRETGLMTLAVEAKVDEPFGPTLGEWLLSASPGKHERLRGILAILDIPEPPKTIRYQLLHRTAAALIEARRYHAQSAGMIVHSFSKTRRWHEDFQALSALFPQNPAPNGIALQLGWIASTLPFSC